MAEKVKLIFECVVECNPIYADELGRDIANDILNEYDKENRELKDFIRNLTNYKGEIVLGNGRCYNKAYVERLLE